MRRVSGVYRDPLEIIWIGTALRLGIEVRRDAEVFASWDGERTLTIGTPETLDADDSLAQMILHELCHAWIEGPGALTKEDWGLQDLSAAGVVHECACLRLQAALADRYGLRHFLAATTDFRSYYDALPVDPLADDGDPAVPMAVAGWDRARNGPWAGPVDRALRITAEIARLTVPFATVESLWLRTERLWDGGETTQAEIPQSLN